MTQQPFNHLLTFLFQHGYFGDNLFKSIDISLGDGTAKLLRDLNIIIKPFPGGLHLLASDPELLDMGTEANPIRLHLHSKDSLFINYTELPAYSPVDKLLYFNNLLVDSNPGSRGYLLHDNQFVGQNEVVQLSNGRISIPSFDPAKEYHFTDVSGKVIPSQFIQSLNNSGDFIFSGLPQNLICIKEGNQEVGRFYYYPNVVWKKPLGMLEIYTKRLYDHYKENGKVEYVVNFKNRQTIWKYFLVSPVYKKFNNLSIINKEKEQTFKTPLEQYVHDKSEALVFESKNKLPISEHSNSTYQLVENYVSAQKPGKVILKKLVNASPDLLYREEANSGETFYSHIYI